MPDASRAIVIFSLEPWGDMWYSKHHYAAHLARTHRVFFVSPPDRWRWTDLFSFRVKVRRTPENVNVIEYRNNLPVRLLSGRLSRLLTRLTASKLRRAIPQGDVLFWCFHPTVLLESPVLRTRRDRVLYHVVDPYQNLPNDNAFATKADLVVVINSWYLGYYAKFNRHQTLIPHGVRTKDREHDPARAAAFRERWGRYVVMAAGINHRTNYSLLTKVADRYPDIRVVLVGQQFQLKPTDQVLRDRLLAQPNVVYAGILHPDELRNIIQGAEAGLVTYDFEQTRSTPIGADGTPLKVITYLAQSCAVVSTINSYAPALDGKGVFKAEDDAHFVDLVGEVLRGERRVDHAAVDAYMSTVEYGRLVERILTDLEAALADAAPEGRTDTADGTADPRPLVPKESPVLVVSNEEWNGPRYSKHRYAVALTALRKVFFIDPPDQWQLDHLFRTRITSQATPEGITVLSYNNAIPLLGGALGGINDRIVSRRLSRHLKRAGYGRPVLWTFDPSRLAAPRLLGAIRSVYHCADDHAFRWRGERLLAERCDHVFCIARELMPRFLKFNPSVHHVPHGLSAVDMEPAAPRAADLPAPPGFGLYIGNINDRHDFVLWEKLFRAHPDINWVLVGPVQVSDPVGLRLIHERPYPNVHFLPTMPYQRLRTLITAAGFGFVYMRNDQAANRMSSQKLVQFLALGKPVFCSWFSEYANRRDLLHMTDDHADAMAALVKWKAEGDPPVSVERRLAFAEGLRFPNLLEQLPFRL